VKLRVISLLLVIAITLVLIPAPVTAVATTPTEIIQQIRTAYRRAISGSGMDSFNGYCGTLVSWQTYCLGIDKRVELCDGNEQYDRYSGLSKTSGGYSVKTYPASKYSLCDALNAITLNGTQDAYNLLVGFQKTNTAAGQVYGHAVFVHAIIDGIVYFVECYNAYLGGRYYSEGEPMSCSISQFSDYYDRWTVFDGVVYFGLKTYADLCSYYSCTMKAMAVADGFIYEEPGDPGIHEPEAVDQLVTGQWHNVTGLLKTPNGKYWYEILVNNHYRYVEAEMLTMGSLDASGVSVSGLKMPGSLRKDYGFTLSGTISSQHSTIRDVRVSVYSADAPDTPLLSAAMDVNGKSASLSQSQLNNALTFRKLPAGSYELRLSVELEIYVFDGNEVTTRVEQVELWNGQFLVVSDWNTYPTVKFDGNGGSPKLDQMVVVKNATIGSLPAAERSGYAFAGWTLDKAGTMLVTPETAITKNTTLYAQWSPGHSGDGGWQETEDGWHYCAGDSPVEGWIPFGDLRFYQYSDGTFAKGWVWIDQNLRFFNSAGALITHLDGQAGMEFDVQLDGGLGAFGWLASGNQPTGSLDFSAEELLQMEKMPAAGRAMQKLSASIYYLAVKITSGQLPQQLQKVLNQE